MEGKWGREEGREDRREGEEEGGRRGAKTGRQLEPSYLQKCKNTSLGHIKTKIVGGCGGLAGLSFTLSGRHCQVSVPDMTVRGRGKTKEQGEKGVSFDLKKYRWS